MHTYTLDEGKRLVGAARHTIELSLKSPYFNPSLISKMTEGLDELDGIFVTLEHYPTMTLRGCIGFPKGMAPIGRAVIDAAKAAAFEDPRFVPVSHKELDMLLVEVSVLTQPQEITGAANQRHKKIKAGKDGLIAKYGMYEGLLLPIVAVEQKWDEKEFLEQVCVKAGIPADSWMQPNVKISKFQSQVFKEEEPSGKVIEIKLH